MKSLIALIFIATVSLATPAAAFDEKGSWMAQGARSCGKWLEYKHKEDGNSWERTVYKNWLAGFISGANAYRPGKAQYLEGTDVQKLHAMDRQVVHQEPTEQHRQCRRCSDHRTGQTPLTLR